MTTDLIAREQILALAKECFTWQPLQYESDLTAFYHAAQRQAYERAERACLDIYGGWLGDDSDAYTCAKAIRALIEGEKP